MEIGPWSGPEQQFVTKDAAMRIQNRLARNVTQLLRLFEPIGFGV
jgi:hypothetical protein